jgi:hypothetical protein
LQPAHRGAILTYRQTEPQSVHRNTKISMIRSRIPTLLCYVAGVVLPVAAAFAWPASGGSRQAGNASAGAAKAATTQDAGADARLARGKKLVLKDGTFQQVRSYERNGDRVRYFSLERGDWEEIPSAMVDWDATAKAELAADQTDAALVSKVHKQEEASKVETVLDVDASLQVAPGVFLPPGEGMFVIEGRSITPLEQVGTAVKTDKKQTLKQVLAPIPIVPSKRNVEIPGAKAKLRFTTATPEFYLREDFDPDRESTIERSSRPSEFGPEVELVRATVKGKNRQLESIRSLLGQQLTPDRKSVSVQRWEVARTVFRFTLSEPLPPGEYALAEILPGGMNMFVWDFGVDGSASKAAAH